MFLKSGGLIFNADLQGPENAPVIVMLHSLGTNFHIWDEMLPSLIRKYRVLRLDMRGHGLSEVGDESFLIEDLADDVINIANLLNIDRFFVVGVSIGGLIAQKLADNSPERILSLILIDTYLYPTSSSMWEDMARNVRNNGLESMADGIFSRWITPAFRDEPSAIGMKRMLLTTPDEGYAKCAEALSKIQKTPPKNIDIPALILVGEHDCVATPLAAKEMAIARGGKIVMLYGAAHIPIFEKNNDIINEINSFIEA